MTPKEIAESLDRISEWPWKAEEKSIAPLALAEMLVRLVEESASHIAQEGGHSPKLCEQVVLESFDIAPDLYARIKKRAGEGNRAG